MTSFPILTALYKQRSFTRRLTTEHTENTELEQKNGDDFVYLSRVGWGKTDSGRMIYEGPVDFVEIFCHVERRLSILLFGVEFKVTASATNKTQAATARFPTWFMGTMAGRLRDRSIPI